MSLASLYQHGVTVSVGNNRDDNHECLKGYMHQAESVVKCEEGRLYNALCSIASKSGTEFCIHIGYDFNQPKKRLPEKGTVIRAAIFMDGRLVTDTWFPIDKKTPEFEVDGEPTPGGLIKPFCFSTRKTTDEEVFEGVGPDNNWLGEIVVNVQWCRPTPFAPCDSWKTDDNDHVEKLQVAVPEHAIQGRNCVAHLGNERRSKGDLIGDTINSPIDDQQYLFHFSYYSADLLVAEGVAPLSDFPGLYPAQPTPELQIKKEKLTPAKAKPKRRTPKPDLKAQKLGQKTTPAKTRAQRYASRSASSD